MLTKAAKYGIRAVVYLEIYSNPSNKISAKKIAQELEIPLPFLAKSLQQLTKNNLVSSAKGPNGGFYLSDTNRKRTIWDVISCVDGREKFNQCFLGLPECSNENPCCVHDITMSFRHNMMKEFKDKNIEQFSKKNKKKKGHLFSGI